MSDLLTLATIVGAAIGIFAARRFSGRDAYRDVPIPAILLGAAGGALLIGALWLVAALRQATVPDAAVARWAGFGLGAALWIGLPVALITHRHRAH